MKHAKKSGKLRKMAKLGNSKSEKLSKSQKPIKSNKNRQKMGIYLISTLKITGQAF